MLIISNATKITAIISEHKKQYYKRRNLERERARETQKKQKKEENKAIESNN